MAMMMWMIAAYRRTHSPIAWFGLKVGSHLALNLQSSNEPGELLLRAMITVP